MRHIKIVPSSEEIRHGLKARHPLEVIIKEDKIDLVSHPIVNKLVDLLWHRLGKKQAIKNGVFTICLLICWTITALAVPANERFLYKYPDDWWRALFFALASLLSVWILIRLVSSPYLDRPSTLIRESLLHGPYAFISAKRWSIEALSQG